MDSVYLETTVLSYLVARPSAVPLIAARQEITKAWWERQRGTFACYISEVVLEEAAQGDAAQAVLRLEAVAGMPKLAASPDAERLADGFLQSALPARAALDAAHLAIAAMAGTKYLLTWNCAHLANAQILDRLEPIALRFGCVLPRVCTPEELMGISIDDW